LPVLATLLQFDAKDYKTIEDGKQKLSWWGTIEAITIGPSTATKPPPVPNAPASIGEVSVSKNAALEKKPLMDNSQRRTTSLQF